MTEQETKANRIYVLLQSKTPDDVAKAHYRRFYGGEPECVIQTGGGTLVGPLPAAVAEARGQGRTE